MENVLFFFIAVTITVAPINTLYEESCQEALVFKPYIKVYDGRSDPDHPLDWSRELFQQGTGLFDTAEWTNAYICLNGPVWLYYERRTSVGVVFDTPVFKIFHHECQFFNGDKGPGSIADKVTLHAVLLMGHERDYRLPFLQLFTAPLFNNETKMYENVTSLMTFGNADCTVTKGTGSRKQTITVIADPNEKHSHCRLSYKHIKQLYPTPTPSTTDTKSGLANPNLAGIYEETLKHDQVLRVESCEDPDRPPSLNITFFNHTTFEDIKSVNYLAIIERWKFKKENVDDNATHPLHDLNHINHELDGASLEGKRQAAFEKAVRLKYDEIDELLTESSGTPSKQFSVPDIMKNINELMKDTNVISALDNFRTGPTDLIAAIAKLQDCVKNSLPVGCDKTVIAGEITTANNTFMGSKPTIEWAATKVKHYLAELKNLLLNVQVLLDEFDFAYKEWGEAVATASTPKAMNFTGNYDPKRFAPFIKMPVNETDPPTPEIKKCQKLPKAKTVCRANRPDKVRTCQLLQAAMGHPQSCATPENATKVSAVTVSPLSELLDDTVKDVLDLIEEIFTNACPQKYFHGNLAKSMNYMFQCYIVKLPQDNGVGIKKKPPGTPLDPKDVENHKFWVHVKDALRECKIQGRTLRFKEAVAGSGVYNFYALTKTGSYEERPVEHLKEQADKEYSFNFALDMHFKIFVTVMGLCMPSYEMKIPLITTMFYAKYTETFFQPLQKTWTDPRDNTILRVILGNFYNPLTLFWATQCMEASFVQSGEKNYRPPRHLPVNGAIEQNFFTSGPLAHSATRYTRSVF